MNAADTPVYFFDTSALVKRYHQEKGTGVVDAAFEEEALRLISDFSVIEAFSAFARKVRMEEMTEEDFHQTRRALATDVEDGTLQLMPLGEEDKREAASLIGSHGPSHGLRTLDAMQLAVMKRQGASRIARVYCADQRFAEIIAQEGFAVIDPEQRAEAS